MKLTDRDIDIIRKASKELTSKEIIRWKKDVEKYGLCPMCRLPNNRCRCIEWGP
jgi:hypothetical protein